MCSSEAHPIPRPFLEIHFRKFLTNKLGLVFMYNTPGSGFHQ